MLLLRLLGFVGGLVCLGHVAAAVVAQPMDRLLTVLRGGLVGEACVGLGSERSRLLIHHNSPSSASLRVQC